MRLDKFVFRLVGECFCRSVCIVIIVVCILILRLFLKMRFFYV